MNTELFDCSRRARRAAGRFAPVVAVLCLLAAAPAQSQSAADRARLARAQAILDQVPVIDGHNDLPSELLSKAGGDPGRFDLTQRQHAFMTDIPRLRAGRVGAQFWSAYISNDSIPTGASLREALRQIDMIHRLVAAYPEHLELARSAADIGRIQKQGKVASLIGVEGGHAIENTLSALRMLHALGARYLTLTHNTTLDWADAAADASRNDGLSEFGKDVVREMNRLGMFVDLSHVSPATMRAAIRVSRAPVIFSHSSTRALTDHVRNVPDDVLRMLPENGGVIMITFVPSFVNRKNMVWEARREAFQQQVRQQGGDRAQLRERLRAWEAANPWPRVTISDVADHIDHARRLAGIDHIGIGSDFDGISRGPVGLEDVSTFPNLFAELLRRGYSEADLRKIAGENLLRAMRRMEAAAAVRAE